MVVIVRNGLLAADWDVTLVPLGVTMASVLEETHRQTLLAALHG
jgi:purine nucleosidase